MSGMTGDEREPAASRNRLLAGLPTAEFHLVAPALELVHCPAGMVLLDAAKRIDRVYFPAGCVAARICTLKDGISFGESIVGSDGIAGIPSFLGGSPMPWRVEVVIGGDALRMPGAALATEFRRGGALQRLLLSYTQELLTQLSFETVCRSHHAVERRLARLLVEIADRWHGTDLPLTQESLGFLLGVRRETVCHAIRRLQSAHAIDHERASVRIVDTARLRNAACGCYRETPWRMEPQG